MQLDERTNLRQRRKHTHTHVHARANCANYILTCRLKGVDATARVLLLLLSIRRTIDYYCWCCIAAAAAAAAVEVVVKAQMRCLRARLDLRARMCVFWCWSASLLLLLPFVSAHSPVHHYSDVRPQCLSLRAYARARWLASFARLLRSCGACSLPRWSTNSNGLVKLDWRAAFICVRRYVAATATTIFSLSLSLARSPCSCVTILASCSFVGLARRAD